MIPDRPALRQLVEQWRAIAARPSRPTGFLICADELEAALEALPLQSEVLTAQRERDEAIRQHGHAVAAVDHAVTAIQTVVNVIGGTVEGAPTHRGNYLQRLRELLQTEAAIKQVTCSRSAAMPLPSADPDAPARAFALALLTDAPPSAETRRAPEDVGQPVTASKGVMPSEPDLQAEATPPAERLQPLDALIAKYEATKGRGHMSSKDVFLAELVRLLAALREAETPQPNGS